jgi:hypothetical protein
MALVVAAASSSSINSRAALPGPGLPRHLHWRRWSGERSGDVPTQGEWGDARVCCAPRISIGPRAGQPAASALNPFNMVAVGVAIKRRFPRSIFHTPGSTDLERRNTKNRREDAADDIEIEKVGPADEQNA